MEEQDVERLSSDRILILDRDGNDPQTLCNVVVDKIPATEVVVTENPREFLDLLASKPFDIVVLNSDLKDVGGGMLLREIKLMEHDPSVIVVAGSDDSMTVNNLWRSGCNGCIVKTDKWIDELGSTVAYLSRQRRMAEAIARRSAQLTEINRMLREKNRRLDEFAMTVAHDIRGPLGGIGMNIEYVLDTHADEIPPRVKELMNRALDTSRRLTDVVQAMYGYAKLGAKAAKMGEVDLQDLAQKVAADLHFNDSLDIKLGIGKLPRVWGNPELLSRVLMNLISNAVKYSDKKEIVINIGTQAIVDRTLCRCADIFIEDNGPGIPHKDLKNLFTMFTRSATNTDGKDGLGIGLAVVHRIIELHYGEISVQSEPGQGTKFLISLPMEESELVV